jgi:hypothetical protein
MTQTLNQEDDLDNSEAAFLRIFLAYFRFADRSGRAV